MATGRVELADGTGEWGHLWGRTVDTGVTSRARSCRSASEMAHSRQSTTATTWAMAPARHQMRATALLRRPGEGDTESYGPSGKSRQHYGEGNWYDEKPPSLTRCDQRSALVGFGSRALAATNHSQRPSHA